MANYYWIRIVCQYIQGQPHHWQKCIGNTLGRIEGGVRHE